MTRKWLMFLGVVCSLGNAAILAASPVAEPPGWCFMALTTEPGNTCSDGEADDWCADKIPEGCVLLSATCHPMDFPPPMAPGHNLTCLFANAE